MAAIALLSRRYIIREEQAESAQPPLIHYLRNSLKSYFNVRTLALSALAYVLFSFGLESISNLSLYTKEAVGREPKELSGVILALRFGFKCLAGYALGALAQRHGIRAPVIGCLLLLGAGILWIWAIPGYSFLFAFGLMGGAELGGLYFPAYVLGVSSAATSARNVSILTLVSGLAGFAPALHGALTDYFGFRASFSLGGLMALLSLILTLQLPARSQESQDSQSEG
jgi:MFS family permease